MKTRVLPGVILIISYSVAFSQELSTPAEIFQWMEQSAITYTLEVLKEELPCPDYSENLLYHNHYRQVGADGQIEVRPYEPNISAGLLMDRAEYFFQEQQFDSALIYYHKVLQADSTLYKTYTYIGQINGMMGRYNQALHYYRQALAKNPVDYMAYWFMADIYLRQGKLEEAAAAITTAHLLNRNNPRIVQSMEKIYKQKGLDIARWCFRPQYRITSASAQAVTISFAENWLGFAMAKAVWAYEPEYRKMKGVGQGQYSTLEDKEALAILAISIKKPKKKKQPDLYYLKKALGAGYFEQYLLYEVVLPRHPQVALWLSEEELRKLRAYFMDYRLKS